MFTQDNLGFGTSTTRGFFRFSHVSLTGVITPSAPPSEPVSEDERMAILKMLQEKKISAVQAEELLKALEGGS